MTENTKEVAQETQEEVVQAINVDEVLSINRRQDVAAEIDKALQTTDLNFYEAILGMCDFTSTILTMELSRILETPEARQASQDRVNEIRGEIVDILNKRKAQFLAEDMIAVISILVESVIIGIKREAAARQEEVATEK